MTPADALARLTAAERTARSYGDASYTGAVALADPGDVAGAADEVSASALGREFLALADGMQELDADAATIGDALDMVVAEAEVAEAARAVKLAEAAVCDAEEQLAAAVAMPVSDPCEGCHQAREAAIAAAQDDLDGAMAVLARARQWLTEALSAAADLAASMRAGLQRRHGGINEAAQSAPVRMADSGFYQPARA